MPYVRKRGNSWSFTVDIGKDPKTGKRKQKTKTGFKSDKEAMREGLKLEEEIERGNSISSPKLSDFMETFFEDHVKHQVSHMTYYNQKYMAEKFILPRFGKYEMNKITPMLLESYFSELVNQGIHRGTIRNVALVFRKAMRSAQRWNVITLNPMMNTRTPKYKPVSMKVWTKDETKRFLEISKSLENYALYVLALTSGMRCGEMLALNKNDFDFVANTVTINKSLKYSLSIGLHLKETKNNNSKRTISLPKSTMDIVKAHIEESIPSKYVFNNLGNPIYPSEVSRKFKNDIKKLGMSEIRFHDMRHTHATILLSMKVNPKVVAERLGHSTVTTTLDTYTHVLPTMQNELADNIQNELF